MILIRVGPVYAAGDVPIFHNKNIKIFFGLPPLYYLPLFIIAFLGGGYVLLLELLTVLVVFLLALRLITFLNAASFIPVWGFPIRRVNVMSTSLAEKLIRRFPSFRKSKSVDPYVEEVKSEDVFRGFVNPLDDLSDGVFNVEILDSSAPAILKKKTYPWIGLTRRRKVKLARIDKKEVDVKISFEEYRRESSFWRVLKIKSKRRGSNPKSTETVFGYRFWETLTFSSCLDDSLSNIKRYMSDKSVVSRKNSYYQGEYYDQFNGDETSFYSQQGRDGDLLYAMLERVAVSIRAYGFPDDLTVNVDIDGVSLVRNVTKACQLFAMHFLFSIENVYTV